MVGHLLLAWLPYIVLCIHTVLDVIVCIYSYINSSLVSICNFIMTYELNTCRMRDDIVVSGAVQIHTSVCPWLFPLHSSQRSDFTNVQFEDSKLSGGLVSKCIVAVEVSEKKVAVLTISANLSTPTTRSSPAHAQVSCEKSRKTVWVQLLLKVLCSFACLVYTGKPHLQSVSSISVLTGSYASPEIASVKKPGVDFTFGKAARLRFMVVVVGWDQEG